MRDDFKDSLDSKNLKLYLQQIAKYPQLNPDQEKELGRRIQEGDKGALKQMIEANLRFVVSYVKKYQGMGLGLLDLINGSGRPSSMPCRSILGFITSPKSSPTRFRR
jgi:DNA-directed RNA polymerase sigma subunit (sigma70/sigma32)